MRLNPRYQITHEPITYHARLHHCRVEPRLEIHHDPPIPADYPDRTSFLLAALVAWAFTLILAFVVFASSHL